ncbi:MAG: leucine-rich repeat domain-containing protein, partial [Muribaculaceae bacterium]|nr:leucine-rich repeat domain-containing protein [Muribaculaceae bacterium]
TVTEVCDDIFGGQSGVKKCAKPSTLKVPTGDNVVAINYDVYDSRIEDGFVYTRNKRAVYFAPTQLPDDYVLPETVKTIGYCAFAYSDFKSVSLGNSLTTIGDYAFYGCSNMSELNIGESVTTIGRAAFGSCSNMSELNIGESVTKIDDYAFYGCRNLKLLRLGKSVSKIGSGAWSNCGSIEAIECSMPTPIAAPNDIFGVNIYDNATLYVPEGSMDKYMDVVPWSYFYNIVEGKAVGGVDNVMADGDDGVIDYTQPYEVYTITGVKIDKTVDELTPGYYIIRQGNTVKKALL